MIFIGDIHGQIQYYTELIKNITHTPTIQVGDMGIGFPQVNFPKQIDGDHWFIRGNHDNPLYAKNHPNYLGEYGYKKEWDLFYVGGADSIDKHMRTLGVSWWPDEEIEYNILNTEVIPLYEKTRPKIVVTHTCPATLLPLIINENNGWGKARPQRTERALQAMFEIHQPDIWVFGHFHRDTAIRMNGTRFICLNALQMIEIE